MMPLRHVSKPLPLYGRRTHPRISRELLRTLRDQLKAAVANSDAALALATARTIRKYDLLIAAPPPPVTYLKRIRLEHPGMCQECLREMAIGDRAFWQESVGVWHIGCRESDDGEPELPLGLDGT